ncbi:MAG: type II secretion system protein [Phycisphaerales bacterium]
MRHRAQQERARGFVLIEVAAILVVACVLLAVIAMLGAESRRQARLGDDIANLRQIGVWTGAYAVDNSDLFWAFSWKQGNNQSQWPDLVSQAAQNDAAAQAAQGVDILRRCAGRLDIQPITGWFPSVRYAHLTLLDYMDTPMPDRVFVSSMDRHRIKWSRDPHGFDAGHYQPAPTGSSSPGTNLGRRWPYSSSFQLPPAFYDSAGIPSGRIYQGPLHNTYFIPGNSALGARSHAEAAFPSHKVLVHDGHARHFGAVAPCSTHDRARLPLLFVDGAVTVRCSAEANPGWRPAAPGDPNATTFNFTPDVWEPATVSGGSSDPVVGRFHWTRGSPTLHGIVGRDFDGPETCSGQPGCP